MSTSTTPTYNNLLTQTSALLATLQAVRTPIEFKNWVRRDLRFVLPHASFLATIGRLFGVGSVPTHRISVDFPLSIVEELKNADGAMNDPLASGWFKSGKLRHVHLAQIESDGPHAAWKNVLAGYGYRDLLVHGAMNYEKQYFVTFHVANIHSSDSLQSATLICDLAREMARAAHKVVTAELLHSRKNSLWHPTISLTPAEIHIIELIARGLSNKEIARLRGVSDSTVKTQVSRTGAKLGATRRAEIVAIAMTILSPLPAQTMIEYEDYPAPTREAHRRYRP